MQLDYHDSFLQLVESFDQLLLCLLILRFKAFLGDRVDVLLLQERLQISLVALKLDLIT